MSQGTVSKHRAVAAGEYLHGGGLGPGSRNCKKPQQRLSVNRHHRAMLWQSYTTETMSGKNTELTLFPSLLITSAFYKIMCFLWATTERCWPNKQIFCFVSVDTWLSWRKSDWIKVKAGKMPCRLPCASITSISKQAIWIYSILHFSHTSLEQLHNYNYSLTSKRTPLPFILIGLVK